jgi:hypothetical protein
MRIELYKHKSRVKEPWYFLLGISCQTTDWHTKKYLFIISLFFWSIYIRFGNNNEQQ